MATVTISSGVHAGTRDASTDMNQGWFGGTPGTQFTTFSLTTATAPQQISGHATLSDLPVEFVVERRARDALTDALATVAVKDLMNGRPFRTVSGWRDAVARAGFLAKVAWSERRNDGGAPEAFEVWGVISVSDASVRGLQESLRFVVWPCDALSFVGTASWWVTPAAYALLDAAA